MFLFSFLFLFFISFMYVFCFLYLYQSPSSLHEEVLNYSSFYFTLYVLCVFITPNCIIYLSIINHNYFHSFIYLFLSNISIYLFDSDYPLTTSFVFNPTTYLYFTSSFDMSIYFLYSNCCPYLLVPIVTFLILFLLTGAIHLSFRAYKRSYKYQSLFKIICLYVCLCTHVRMYIDVGRYAFGHMLLCLCACACMRMCICTLTDGYLCRHTSNYFSFTFLIISSFPYQHKKVKTRPPVPFILIYNNDTNTMEY